MENRNGDGNKKFWSNGYQNWSNEEFKERLGKSKKSFEFILHRIKLFIEKTPTKMVPIPIESHRTLARKIDGMVHGCSFKTLTYLVFLNHLQLKHSIR